MAVGLHSAEAIPYALPFREPYVTARGALTRREMVLLRLRNQNGLVGLGEAVPLSLRGGASLAEVVRELEELVAGDVLPNYFAHGSFEVFSMEEIDPRLALSAPSWCALLTAVLDLYGQEDDPPDSQTAPVPCNATLVHADPTTVANAALEWAEDGFETFKLKLGVGEDVAQVRAVREALGPEAKIRVDANAAWSLDTATEILAELEPLDIELVEQPVETFEDAAELSRRTSIPLAGDESIVNQEDAERAVDLDAFQVAGIKLSKVGGFYAGMEIAEVMPCYVSSALDGPVGIAAGAHLADSAHYDAWSTKPHQFAHGLATQRLFASTIASVECELRGGMLHPPVGPGLGVEIDEDALQAHRL
jgi:O-succinylbenzoate synthase